MPSENLAALERRFYALATAGDAAGDIDDDYVGTPGLSAAARLRVYADMYLVRLLDTLADYFPELASKLGREAFDDLARGYLRVHPPTSTTLRDLGRALPGFLAGTEHAALAELEWTRIDLFDGPDGAPLGLEDFQALDPEALAELQLALNPTARILGDDLLVYRQGFHVHDRRLDADEARALAAVARGTTVGGMCELIGDAQVAFARITAWLSTEILTRGT